MIEYVNAVFSVIAIVLLVKIARDVHWLRQAWKIEFSVDYISGTQDWEKDGEVYVVGCRGATLNELNMKLVERGIEMQGMGFTQIEERD